jgi:hypothetical protein
MEFVPKAGNTPLYGNTRPLVQPDWHIHVPLLKTHDFGLATLYDFNRLGSARPAFATCNADTGTRKIRNVRYGWPRGGKAFIGKL